MAKSRPSENQSERSDLSYDYLAILSVLALEIFRNKNYMKIGNVPIIYSEVSIVQIINQRTFYQGCFLNLNGSLYQTESSWSQSLITIFHSGS